MRTREKPHAVRTQVLGPGDRRTPRNQSIPRLTSRQRVESRRENEAADPLDVWAVPTSSSANRAAAFVVRLAPGNETSQLATFGDAFALRRGDAWHLIAETFLTHSEPVAPALALRSRVQEAFSVTHALAPPRQVPPGGAEGWRLQHGEHLLLRDAADNLVASLALDKPKRESRDEI